MIRSRMKPLGLVLLAGFAIVGCGPPQGPDPTGGGAGEVLPPQGNGDIGALSFSRAVFGVELDGEVIVSRPVAVACGPGCSRVETRPITSAGAMVDPPLAALSAPQLQPDGSVRFRVRGAASGTAKLWLDVVVDGRTVRDTIDLRVLVPESWSLGCALDGFSVGSGLLVGAQADCELEAVAEGRTLGTLVPQAAGGLRVEPAAAPATGFHLTATAPGRGGLAAAAGGRSFAQPVDVVAEDEVAAVRLFDVEAMKVRTGTLAIGVGRAVALRPQVVTSDGRAALGFEDRVSATPSQILRLQLLPTHRFVLAGLAAGDGTLAADIGGRRYDIPVRVE